MHLKLIVQLMRKISLVCQFDIEFLKVTPEWMTLPIKALLVIKSRCLQGFEGFFFSLSTFFITLQTGPDVFDVLSLPKRACWWKWKSIMQFLPFTSSVCYYYYNCCMYSFCQFVCPSMIGRMQTDIYYSYIYIVFIYGDTLCMPLLVLMNAWNIFFPPRQNNV